MRSFGLLLLVAVLSVVALGLGCSDYGSCDCGQAYSTDVAQVSGPPLGIGLHHSPSVHCYCYCDDRGQQVRFPPSRDCSYFDVACTNADGREGTFHCVGGVHY